MKWIVGFLLLRCAYAAFLPITFDEAYYLVWTSTLPKMGFLDHPPIVAWLGTGFLNSAWSARWMVTVLVGPLAWWFFRRFSSRYHDDLRSSYLFLLHVGLFAGSILLTPDAGLMLSWMMAIYYLDHAFHGDENSWLGVGFAVGLGILSKYTMVIFLGVICVCWFRRRAPLRAVLKGLIVALLTYSPNLIWNAQHDWRTWRFQAGRGLVATHTWGSEQQVGATVRAYPATEMDEEWILFALSKPKAEREATPAPTLLRYLHRVGDFLGGQIALWGVLGLALLVSVRRWVPIMMQRCADLRWMVPAASFAVPFLFFSVLSPFVKIEANWPVLAVPGFLVLIADKVFWRWWFALAQVVLLFGLIVFPPSRLRDETRGFNELVEFLPKDRSIFADRYQIAAQLRIRGVPAGQLPGITRPSEFTVEPKLQPPIEGGRFVLVMSEYRQLCIPGFRVEDTRSLETCLEGCRNWFLLYLTREPGKACFHA